MSPLLKDLIKSAREYADEIETDPQPDVPTAADRWKRLVALESARQLRSWIVFAENADQLTSSSSPSAKTRHLTVRPGRSVIYPELPD